MKRMHVARRDLLKEQTMGRIHYRYRSMPWGVAVGALIVVMLTSGCTRHGAADDTSWQRLSAEDYVQQDVNNARMWWQGYAHRFDAEKLKLRGGSELLQHITRVDGRLLGWVTKDLRIDGPGGMFGAAPGLLFAPFYHPPIFMEERKGSEHEELMLAMERRFQRGVDEGQYVEASGLLERVASVHNMPLCTLMFALPPQKDALSWGESAHEWAEVHIFVAACEWRPDDFPRDEYVRDLREVRLYIACDASVHHILLFPKSVSLAFLRAYFELTAHHVDYSNPDELEEIARKLGD